jgi:hypothetical protein
MKLIIEMQDRENYAAHNGFTGEYYWKNKIGATYIVNNVSEDKQSDIVDQVRPFIEKSDDYFSSEVGVVYLLEDDQETEYVQMQKEYDPEGTVYLPAELKQNAKGVWFEKRGYLISSRVNAELGGQFIGYVDNLETGKTVKHINPAAKLAA